MRLKVFLLIIAVLITACSGGKKQEQAANEVRPTDVEVTKVVLSDIDDYYTVPGTVEAWDDITVPSETSGPV